MMEHNIKNRALGVYFSDKKAFYYLDDTEAKEIFSFKDIKKDLKNSIISLREGSDKLVEKFFANFDVDIENGDFWQRAGAIIGVEGGFEALNKIALGYGGKGGLSVDCRIRDGGFDYESFYSSLMSYKLAEVDEVTLAYSIFESLGDFLSNTLKDAAAKIGVNQFLICGKYIANSALFSRFVRNLPNAKTNISLPVDEINLLVGI
jgi:hypothetical protein